MMKEVKQGIAIGLVAVFTVVGIGSFIAQALMGDHAPEAAAEAPAEKAEEAK